MLWIRWAFIAANVVLSLLCLHWSSRNPSTTFGKIAGVAIWMWQLVGVTLVVFFKLTAWHLVWWFILGYLLVMRSVQIMTRMGYYTKVNPDA
ncbi:MAG TPA: hypothetical protein VK578_02620 [Edaphobacter sp.]|nr:hypothetical protein [Edaphobacter sp.]